MSATLTTESQPAYTQSDVESALQDYVAGIEGFSEGENCGIGTEADDRVVFIVFDDEVDEDVLQALVENAGNYVQAVVDGISEDSIELSGLGAHVREVKFGIPVDVSVDSPRLLGTHHLDAEELRDDPNYTVRDLPKDMVENHLTKTFTPSRYAKICRDIAYFTSAVGAAPKTSMGEGRGTPGSGMRRSKEGALYNLAHREALLKRAVQMNLITTTNDDGFDAEESEWRFDITGRGEWFLNQYYGDHIPVRAVTTVKLSRHSTAKNLTKKVVCPDDVGNIKSVDEWNEQVEDAKWHNSDVANGHYHVSRQPSENVVSDPSGIDLIAWVDNSNAPLQFDVTALNGDVKVMCDMERLADTDKHVSITMDGDDLVVEGPVERQPVHVVHHLTGSNSRTGFKGDYEAFVKTGAKDALKENHSDATWANDYKVWHLSADETLDAVESILSNSGVDTISIPARTFHEFSHYL